MNAIDILKTATHSYDPCVQENGEIHDPALGAPFQYGTPYYTVCNAVLALKTAGAERDAHVQRALKGLEASLNHVVRIDLPPTISSLDRDTGTTRRVNHRDFFWPPILKSYLILRGLGQEVGRFEDSIRSVDVEEAFRSRPPSNWAMVWLSGEWLRIREGLSPNSIERFDEWLAVFFSDRIDIDKGFYHEPGHPNCYDLFTRFHLADILQEGYDGRSRDAMCGLMETGLERSLAVQLSDGSVASAYRSTGLSWTVGVECAYFTHAARFFESRDRARSRAARDAARRALSSFARWQRKDSYYSPVENCLPGAYRVGYEGYTTEANHGLLPTAALAAAVLNGLDDEPLPSGTPKPTLVRIEHDPTYRAIAHRGLYSVHFNAFPSPRYDGFGIVDMTFGPNRFLHFASSVKSLHSGKFLNVGLAHKSHQVDGELTIIARKDFNLAYGFRRVEGNGCCGFALEGRAKGEYYTYAASVEIDDAGIVVNESTPGLKDYKSLLIPYLKDPGTGMTTDVIVGKTIRFILGDEEIEFVLGEEIDRVIHLPYGYENRRGLCGLIRIDFKGVREGIVCRVRSVK